MFVPTSLSSSSQSVMGAAKAAELVTDHLTKTLMTLVPKFSSATETISQGKTAMH